MREPRFEPPVIAMSKPFAGFQAPCTDPTPRSYFLVIEQVLKREAGSGRRYRGFLTTSLRGLFPTVFASGSESENEVLCSHSMQSYGTSQWSGSYTHKTDIRSWRTHPGSSVCCFPIPWVKSSFIAHSSYQTSGEVRQFIHVYLWQNLLCKADISWNPVSLDQRRTRSVFFKLLRLGKNQ